MALTANNTLPLFNGLLRPDALNAARSLDPIDPLADRWINRPPSPRRPDFASAHRRGPTTIFAPIR